MVESAIVVDFASRRAKPTLARPPAAPPTQPVPKTEDEFWRFKEPRTIATNPRNRYDAAFKGYMAKRASELIRELREAMWREDSWRPFHPEDRNARISWVIREIEKMRDEVLLSTPEQHRPVE